jgi:hypothetical protein
MDFSIYFYSQFLLRAIKVCKKTCFLPIKLKIICFFSKIHIFLIFINSFVLLSPSPLSVSFANGEEVVDKSENGCFPGKQPNSIFYPNIELRILLIYQN